MGESQEYAKKGPVVVDEAAYLSGGQFVIISLCCNIASFHSKFLEQSPKTFVIHYIQDYTMRFAFRQKWKDPRLSFPVRLTHGKGHPYIQLESADQIWYPDYFLHERPLGIHP